MAIRNIFPEIKPSLNIDFANTKRLDPRIEFTRATPGNYYDGKTFAKAEENLLTYSQEFDNATWTTADAAVTKSGNTAVAPDGTSTADTLANTVATGGFAIQQAPAFLANTSYTFSFYVKNVDGQYATATLAGSSSNYGYAEFDLAGAVVSRSGATGTGWSVTATSITSVGSGWYRCVVVITTGSTVSLPRTRIGLSDGAGTISVAGLVNYTASSVKSIYIWGAQLEQRSSVTAYTATTTKPVTNYLPVLMTAPAGVARFDHNPVTGESLGLLIEESRANLLTYSEQFSNAEWTKTRCSILENVIVAPDGTLTGDKLVEDTSASNTHRTSQSITTTAGAYTFTCFFKAGERGYVALYDSTIGSGQVFDLLTGVVGVTTGAAAPISASIQSVGNGWYRCSLTVTATAASNTFQVYPMQSNTSDTLYTGDGTSGIYIWGAQLEAGAFATSYIPTTSAGVTRAADAASMTGTNFSSWYRQDEGGFLMCARSEGSGNNGRLQMDDGTALNRLIVSANVAAATEQFVIAGNVTQATLNVGTFPSPADIKSALAYKVNDFAGVANGGSIASDSSGVVPLVTTMRIGANQSATYGRSWYKRIAYYPARLTNAQWQALTA